MVLAFFSQMPWREIISDVTLPLAGGILGYLFRGNRNKIQIAADNLKEDTPKVVDDVLDILLDVADRLTYGASKSEIKSAVRHELKTKLGVVAERAIERGTEVVRRELERPPDIASLFGSVGDGTPCAHEEDTIIDCADSLEGYNGFPV